jgi:hypothetical protein
VNVADDQGAYVLTWSGIVDFDDAAPVATFTRLTAVRSTKPANAYVVRVGFAARDDPGGGVVSYLLDVGAGGASLSVRTGTVAGTSVSLVQTIRPPGAARTVSVDLTLKDAVGNTRVVKRVLALPR